MSLSLNRYNLLPFRRYALETVKVYLHKLQKATYHYINVQAQWQCFNGGNWVYLENGLRDFVTEKAGAAEQATLDGRDKI